MAEDASIPELRPEPSLSEQFGLHCAVVRHLTQGFPYKVDALLVCSAAAPVHTLLTHLMDHQLHGRCRLSVAQSQMRQTPSQAAKRLAGGGVQGLPPHKHRQPQGGERPHGSKVFWADAAWREKPKVCRGPNAIAFGNVRQPLRNQCPVAAHLRWSYEQRAYWASTMCHSDSQHRGGFYGATDVYDLTPYSKHPYKYVRAQQQPRTVGRRWSASVYPRAIAAMHFKWHSGVLQRYPASCVAEDMSCL